MEERKFPRAKGTVRNNIGRSEEDKRARHEQAIQDILAKATSVQVQQERRLVGEENPKQAETVEAPPAPRDTLKPAEEVKGPVSGESPKASEAMAPATPVPAPRPEVADAAARVGEGRVQAEPQPGIAEPAGPAGGREPSALPEASPRPVPPVLKPEAMRPAARRDERIIDDIIGSAADYAAAREKGVLERKRENEERERRDKESKEVLTTTSIQLTPNIRKQFGLLKFKLTDFELNPSYRALLAYALHDLIGRDGEEIAERMRPFIMDKRKKKDDREEGE